ncbi:type II toxin-antitoxin system HicA family toxin [Candidatus Thiosymbion oneisti]|uniref:type II toxin-antitoxin system HicA family toxin n=1 Tax=Candidatus Thiosymbion oneisti TaxID=589554 RepID=UPI000B800FEC|nr:type II toxin-antitoxin system HicA family toxin [Candidatus Thiosymbion oneisti]
MNSEDRFKAFLDTLESAKAAMRCRDMVDLLDGLGFEVRDGRKQGHKIVFHENIAGFFSASFTCGHGRNPEIKPAYVKQIRKLLLRYKSELLSFLETRDEH